MAERRESEGRPDDEQFAEAVAVANIPTLLMVLVQLTGELHWLEKPYRPSRVRGMGDNDTGGLPEPAQTEIPKAALEAILAWRAGRPVAIPEPSPELRVRMLSCAMGEEIPPEYAPMVAAQLGFDWLASVDKIEVPEGFQVLIIGAGVSGLCAAVNLQRAGIPFRILEKSATVGGTWRDNRYPGAGVDTPNHLYSFSFATYDWSMYFALRDELHGYLEHVADRFGLRPSICFETEVESAAYQDKAQRWDVIVRNPDGSRETLSANVLISVPGSSTRSCSPLSTGSSTSRARPSTRRSGPPTSTSRGSTWRSSATVRAPCSFLTTFEARGRSGRSLREVWDDDDARAYLGLAIPDFPNFFCLYGPNTQPGHGGSLIFVVEMQMRYIMAVLGKMVSAGIGAVECRQDVHDAYNERVDSAHENMVWTHKGMETYYRNTRGRVVVNFPFRNVDLFQMTGRAELSDFITKPALPG